MIIKTKSGKEYHILWDGIAYDGVLRFAVIDGDMMDIFNTFSDGNETETLTKVNDGQETVYSGFSVFYGATKDRTGSIVVALKGER